MTSGRFYAETGKWGKGVKLSGKAKVELAQYVLKWTVCGATWVLLLWGPWHTDN